MYYYWKKNICLRALRSFMPYYNIIILNGLYIGTARKLDLLFKVKGLRWNSRVIDLRVMWLNAVWSNQKEIMSTNSLGSLQSH